MERKSSEIRKSTAEVKFIKDKRAEGVRISNMQKTLSKKANELSILCGVEIAILIFSIGCHEPFLFGNPDVDSVVHQFLEAKQQSASSFNIKKKKKVERNEANGKSVEGDFTHLLSEDFKLTEAERLEKLNHEIEKLEHHLNKEIDFLQNVIGFEDPKFMLEMNGPTSLTIPPNWLSL
ncbi:agamous-like MADS-box protein AGL29 [Solanum dulcamara]|uniref:agamous-like MADS-box protein AGL29 n=1 Tax=Solanum dulcamara TaxID=45834 RepID=UPI0024867C9F|nr:agamous-like MADS-box protein AGL29 [Solanum dulcamara]